MTAPAVEHPTRPAVLFADPNFRWLIGGGAISMLGDQFTLFAMPWLVLKLTRDSFDLGLVLTLFGLPRAVFILAGGAVTDRYSPRLVLLATKYTNAALLAVLAGLVLTGGLSFGILCVLALALGLASAFSIPAGSAIMPKSLAPEHLQKANGILMSIWQLSMLVGPLLAGGLVAWLGTGPAETIADAGGLGLAFAIDAASFLVSAWTLHQVRNRPEAAPAVAEPILRAIGAALAHFWRDRSLRGLCLFFAANALMVSGPTRVALPVLADLQFGDGAGGFALLSTAQGVGALVGMVLSGALPRLRVGTLGMTVLMIDLAVGLLLLGFLSVTQLWQALALLAVMGTMGGFIQVVVFTWMQRRIPPAMLGRGMSLFMFIFMGIPPLSSALAGALMRVLPPTALFAACGAVLILVVAIGLANRDIRSINPAPATA